jgi:hypothetical protein
VGADTGCGYLITVNADGQASAGSQLQGPFDGSEDTLVGIVNDSDAAVSSIELSGSDIFGFDGDGLCSGDYTFLAGAGAYCATLTDAGTVDPYDYEGPDNTFAKTDNNDGTVDFTTPLAPGGTTFFALEDAPFTVGTVGLEPAIVLTASPVSGTEGLTTGLVQVASFNDGPNTSPTTDFTATTNWGDGTPSSTSSISQPGGAPNPYVVTDSHTYAEEGTDTTTVKVIDKSLPLNVASASSTATIADAPLSPTATQPSIPNATTNKSFTAEVATFTDDNPTAPLTDYTTSPGGAVITWGDGSSPSAGTVTQPGGLGTVFEVSGTHTYAANGTYTISVKVTDVGLSTVAITNYVTDYDAVITCSSSPCTGTATSTSQSTAASTTSTTGTILLDLNTTPVGGTFSCNDPFRHAVQYSTILESGLAANGSVDLTISFANSAAGGFWLDPFAVCFKSPEPFTDLFGRSVTLGLLPICPFARPGHPVVGPCVQSIEYSTIFPLPSEKGTVTEKLVVPPNDPLSH